MLALFSSIPDAAHCAELIAPCEGHAGERVREQAETGTDETTWLRHARSIPTSEVTLEGKARARLYLRPRLLEPQP
jgi:hypothetical protein